MKIYKHIRVLLAGFIAVWLCAFTVFAVEPSVTSVGSEELPYETYTYWQGYGYQDKTPVYCKPMYGVKTVINAVSLGIGHIDEITDIYTDESGNTYILDDKASSVYVVDSNYNLAANISNITLGGEKQTIEGAKGIFVKDENIYLADTDNERVLIFGMNGIVTKVLTRPDSKLIPDDFKFRPIKIAVDSKNYTYIACDGSYYGAIVYSPTMGFLGFYGANTVAATALDVLQNITDRLFSNDTKKSSSVLALPYQFTDMVVGPKDFIYTATGKAGGAKLQTGQIRVMNPGGKDILKEDDNNFLDSKVGIYKTVSMDEDIAGIDVDKDGFFYIVDSTYGRIFWYDSECNPMCVFGGSLSPGKQKGTFSSPCAIAVNGTDVLVGDGMKDSVTVFQLTEYGAAVRRAQLKTLNDDFETAVDEWQSIVKKDKNNQLAYKGLAKAYYTLGDNEKALEYARLGSDRETYNVAFEKLRRAFFEKWFSVIFVCIVITVTIIIIFLRIKKKKNLRIINNSEIRLMFKSVFHPFESFGIIKEKSKGSILCATVLLLTYFILSAVSDTASGFTFNYFDAANYNSIYLLIGSVGLVLLWTVSNWLVCVLMGGIGKIREIYIVVCYSLQPIIFASLVSIIMSHVLVPEEFVFVNMLSTVCVIYTLFMVMVGTMKVHDFEFGKFLFTSLLTFIAMIIVIFLISLMFLLTQQLVGWIQTLIVEMKYR